MKQEFRNEYVFIRYTPKSENQKADIYLKDLTDLHNEPSAFTRKVRGIEKAWAFICQVMADERLKDDMKFSDFLKILDGKFGLDTHYYCALD